MTKTRPTFSDEFKREAAGLVLDQNYSIADACQAMGVGQTAIRRWVKQLESERAGKTPQSGKALTSEQQRIQQLEKRIKQLEWEKEILKKATALFVSEPIKS